MSRDEFRSVAGHVALITGVMVTGSFLVSAAIVAWLRLVDPWVHYTMSVVMPLAWTPVVTFPLLLMVQRTRRMKAEMERLAHTDVLTGLPNRRAFFQAGDRLLRSADAEGRPCGVLMIDIDHFKTINDRHGHDVGDMALKAVAEAILRTLDSVAGPVVLGRIGGEEFAAMVPAATGPALSRLAERLCQEIRALVVDAPHGPVTTTVSVGFAERKANEAFDDVLRRADGAVYRAKSLGRDRACQAGDTEPRRRPASLDLPQHAA